MKRCGLLLVLLALTVLPARAQFPEDALRFATPTIGVGARALGMGGAYTGIANDFSGLSWNPAGLTQVRKMEFSLGMSYLSFGDVSSFGSQSSIIGEPTDASTSSTSLNALGLVIPVATTRGRLSVALGYNRGANFATALGFAGFNPVSSIVQSFAPDSAFASGDLAFNPAYQLYLANIDSTTGRFISPIKGNVDQFGDVLEKGGLDNWSFGLGIDVARDVSVGARVTYLAGSYRYERAYEEGDGRNLYTTYPFDFSRLYFDEFVESHIGGWVGKFGLMASAADMFRLGLTVTTPTWLSVDETFGVSSESRFDNGERFTYNDQAGSHYEVVTPWVFGGGASVVLGDVLVLSGDVEWTDWSTLEFQNAAPELLALNNDMRAMFTSTLNWRAGAEVDLLDVLRLRAGFRVDPSPYKDDPSDFDRKYATAGVGLPLGSSFMLDLAYAYGYWNSYRVNYTDPRTPLQPRVDEEITTHQAMVTVSYRY